jgi:glycerol-3-phosphate dehydrogenase
MKKTYDLVIIGGGINGVGVAQAAAAQGYTVALLEQTSLASGTSGRSSKLIHGGLRYLETGRFGLVHELLREREILLKNAPGLVTLAPFYIPIYHNTRRRPWHIKTGLALYCLLSGLKRHTRFRSVPPKEWSALDGLQQEGLQAVFQYWDGRTDDAELTRAVMTSAQALGAELFCPARLLSADIGKKEATVHFQAGGSNQTVHGRALVNAAGPWVNKVLDLIHPAVAPLPIELVQGSHIILDKGEVHGTYYVEAHQDLRAVLVMPWQGRILVGSTETRFTGSPEDVRPLPEEIAYLQQVVRDYFPGVDTAVVESFAGLRVLLRAGESLNVLSREVVLHVDPRCLNLVNIYGGKLTDYRATAQKVMKLLRPVLPAGKQSADTARLPLAGKK